MEVKIEEGVIKDAIEPATMRQTEIILNQMKKSVCKILLGPKYGTGFFCKLKINDNEIKVLITNYHVIDDAFLNSAKQIKFQLGNDKIPKLIHLNQKKKYSSIKEQYDIMIIQLDNKDEIDDIQFLEIDDSLLADNSERTYEDKTIYILQYPSGEEIKVSYGKGFVKEDDNNMTHKCSTNNGSSGSPIFDLSSNKVIGIHKSYLQRANKNESVNLGTFLKYPLKEMEKLFQKPKENIKNTNIHLNQCDRREKKKIVQDNISSKQKMFQRLPNHQIIKNLNVSEKNNDISRNDKRIKPNKKNRNVNVLNKSNDHCKTDLSNDNTKKLNIENKISNLNNERIISQDINNPMNPNKKGSQNMNKNNNKVNIRDNNKIQNIKSNKKKNFQNNKNNEYQFGNYNIKYIQNISKELFKNSNNKETFIKNQNNKESDNNSDKIIQNNDCRDSFNGLTNNIQNINNNNNNKKEEEINNNQNINDKKGEIDKNRKSSIKNNHIDNKQKETIKNNQIENYQNEGSKNINKNNRGVGGRELLIKFVKEPNKNQTDTSKRFNDQNNKFINSSIDDININNNAQKINNGYIQNSNNNNKNIYNKIKLNIKKENESEFILKKEPSVQYLMNRRTSFTPNKQSSYNNHTHKNSVEIYINNNKTNIENINNIKRQNNDNSKENIYSDNKNTTRNKVRKLQSTLLKFLDEDQKVLSNKESLENNNGMPIYIPYFIKKKKKKNSS